MKRRVLSSLLAVCLAFMSGCSDKQSSSDGSVSSSAAESSSVSDTSSAAQTTTTASTTSETVTTTSSAEIKYDYVHGTDGYYNLADELKYFKMPMQQEGTCWLYAGRASMATAYEKQTGKELKMEIADMLEAIYGDNKPEGILIKKSVDMADLGGYQEFVTERLSRGFKDGITLDSSVVIDPTDRDAIKNAVKTRGGVTVGIDDENSEKDIVGTYPTLIYKEAKEYDHAVTVLGWDDHFPKEYFKEPASQDGAWIVYNSNLGSQYHYISYDSPFEFAVSHTVSDKYSDVLSYDAGNMLNSYIRTGDSTKTANVFHKKGRLAAVGTFNDFDRQDIKIEIMSADFKTVLYSQDTSLDYHGYHTVELTKPVEVEDYAVVITYSKGAPVEGESFDTVVGNFKTAIEKGQSFVFVGDKWKDMTDNDIKTAVKTDRGKSDILGEHSAWRVFMKDDEIKAMLKTDFEPGNCCIKALYG